MKALYKAWIYLLLVCLAALFSTTALADDDNIESGTCGVNVTWTLDTDTGVLTISGTGEMTDYGNSVNYHVPWDSLGNSIETVIIEDGVTSIGDWGFMECNNLTRVKIPNSVTSIGSWAFSRCNSLTSVTIPNSITTIWDGAFSGCSSMTSVTIPDSVTSIGESAFYDTAYYNDSENWENSVLYIDHWLIEAKSDISGNYEIKAGTIGISDMAFEYCSSLTSVTIPDSVTSIGDYAFYGCSSLTSATIPDSVTSIGCGAFYDTVYYNDSENWENSVLYIDHWLIEAKSDISGNCEIKAGTIGISDMAFEYCSSLTSVTIPDSVTSISESAFRLCSSLTSVTIPYSVTSIGYGAFAVCSSLTDVYYGGSEAEWNAIEIDNKYNANDSLISATIHYNSTIDTDDADDEPTSPTTPGDLNGDGEVNASDLTILARHVGKVEYITDETYLANADVTGDGSVDASDLTRLAQYVGKIISSLD